MDSNKFMKECEKIGGVYKKIDGLDTCRVANVGILINTSAIREIYSKLLLVEGGLDNFDEILPKELISDYFYKRSKEETSNLVGLFEEMLGLD